MPANFTAYKINKIISIGWVFLVIALSAWWFGYGQTQWQFILITIMTFGYAHFIVGFIYQLKSFFKKPDTTRYLISFSVLVVVTIVFAQVLFLFAGYAFALFVGFVYFLLHGLFNEQTLIKREGGIDVPLIYIWSLAVFIMSLLTYTVPDPTFLFNRELVFSQVDDFLLTVFFAGMGIPLTVFPYIFWSGMGISFLILFFAWKQSRNNPLTIFLGISYSLVILATLFWGALPYIYMYFLVVGYHFMTWFIFFIRQMKGYSKNALLNFSLIHVVVLLPFIFGGWLFFEPDTPQWAMMIFDYKFFVVATYVHISTSFMNDLWFVNLQSRVFERFG